MSARPLRGLAALAALLAAGASAAPPGSAAARPDPLDPAAAVPPALHRSAFQGYRAAGDQALGSWREANERVARIGGWRAYTREANAPEPPAGAASAPPAAGGPGHHGHHGGGGR